MSRVIEKEIVNLGQSRNFSQLQEYISSLSSQQLCNLVASRISHVDAPQVWMYLLQGFTDSKSSQDKRLEVVEKVLSELATVEVSSNIANCFITSLCAELHRFSVPHLVKLTDHCIDAIHAGDHKYMSWKDLLPQLILILVECDSLIHCDTEMSGVELKSEVISSLCMVRWPNNIVTALAAMFIEMPLSKEEHLKVSNKLCSCIDALDPPAIPPLVHQLLTLCNEQNTVAPLFKLCSFFSEKLYGLQQMDSENTNVDVDSIDQVTNKDLAQAEGTVLYHLNSSAMSPKHGSIKDFIASLRHINKSPGFILRPFPLMALLSMACSNEFELKVYEVIKLSINRNFHDNQLRKSSAWFHEVIPDEGQCDTVFMKIIECSADRPIILEGLMNLSLYLLSCSTPGSECMWLTGMMILTKVMKKQRHVAHVVLQGLCNRIVTEQSSPQFTSCLRHVAMAVPLILVENQTVLKCLLDQLLQIPGVLAKRIVIAIIPVVKLSPSLRDYLILILRKAMFSRDCAIRKMAAHGICWVLRTLRLNHQGATFTQQSIISSWSGPSVFTQMSIEVHQQVGQHGRTGTLEPLCLELLGVLRRGLMQQSEVKEEMYEGFYEAICKNPPICCSVLEMVFPHFKKFYVSDDQSLPPFKFDDIVVVKDTDAVLTEPIGQLLLLISRVIVQTAEVDTLTASSSRNQINMLATFNSLCERMPQCELEHIQLDDGVNITDVLPECKKKSVILKQVFSILESLIMYQLMSWNRDSEDDPGKVILRLFNKYHLLVDFSKTSAKGKKSDAKKKKSDRNATSQNVTHLGAKPIPFKMPKTLFDLSTLVKIIELLYSNNVDWATAEQSNSLKKKREFHHYILKNLNDVLLGLGNTKSLDFQHGKNIFKHICTLGDILYKHCICKFSTLEEFDIVTSLLVVEAMKDIFNVVITHYKEKQVDFLTVLSPNLQGKSMGELIKPVLDTYRTLVDISFSDEEEPKNEEEKKTAVLLMETVNILCEILPVDGTNTFCADALEWLKSIATEKNTNNKKLVDVLHNTFFNVNSKVKITSNLYDTVALQVCELFGTINKEVITTTSKLKTINDLTMESATLSLCNVCKSQLDQVDWIVYRLKGDHLLLMHTASEEAIDRLRERLKSKERSVCAHLCLTMNVLAVLSNASLPIGQTAESVLRVLLQAYTTLGQLAKYFYARSSPANPVYEHARFERVVKLAGKTLSKLVYDFITHIEQTQAKKNKSKVLRETRSIPKVLYAIETFKKYVILLSNKTTKIAKVQLISYINLGTSRDFRIMKPALKSALDHLNETQAAAEAHADNSGSENEVAVVSEDENNENVLNDLSRNSVASSNNSNGSPVTSTPDKKITKKKKKKTQK